MTWKEFYELLNDEERLDEMAGDISTRLFAEFMSDKPALPDVCEGGQECRNRIFEDAQLQLKNEWIDVLNRVNGKLENAFLENKVSLESGFKEEFLCDDGCYCEEIEGTYTDHIRLQRELEKEIKDLQTDVALLYKKQQEILVTCPDYEESALVVPEQYQL
jgi:hypothetical protein